MCTRMTQVAMEWVSQLNSCQSNEYVVAVHCCTTFYTSFCCVVLIGLLQCHRFHYVEVNVKQQYIESSYKLMCSAAMLAAAEAGADAVDLAIEAMAGTPYCFNI